MDKSPEEAQLAEIRNKEAQKSNKNKMKYLK